MASMYWREAASLIIIGKSFSRTVKFKEFQSLYSDYDILFLRRSSKSHFMPATHVFPGGTVEEADTSQRWLNFYQHQGYHLEDLTRTFRKESSLLRFGKLGFEHQLHELAYRICALRETFEETGLLLGRDNKHRCQLMTCLTNSSLKEWRNIVHKDPDKFLRLHQELSIVPDIWSLLDWDSWLTPTFFGGKNKRFDTFFYIVFLDNGIPELVHDDTENEAIYRSQAIEQCVSYYKRGIIMAPPQLYNMGRFLKYPRYKDLKTFSEEREKHGMNRWLPVLVKAKDGVMTVLEGDELFPKMPDFYGKEEDLTITESLEESRVRCTSMNRFEYYDRLAFPVVKLTSTNNHIVPLDLSIFRSKSKL